MTLYHGYPQHPAAHPEVPWWRFEAIGGWSWVRRAHDGTSPVVDIGSAWPDEAADEYDARLLVALEEVDARYPVPPPPPLVGQVWVTVVDGEVSGQHGVTND